MVFSLNEVFNQFSTGRKVVCVKRSTLSEQRFRYVQSFLGGYWYLRSMSMGLLFLIKFRKPCIPIKHATLEHLPSYLCILDCMHWRNLTRSLNEIIDSSTVTLLPERNISYNLLLTGQRNISIKCSLLTGGNRVYIASRIYKDDCCRVIICFSSFVNQDSYLNPSTSEKRKRVTSLCLSNF